MNEQLLLGVLILLFALAALRKGMIDSYKIGYYEQKLKNRDVDIARVEHVGLIDIWRL